MLTVSQLGTLGVIFSLTPITVLFLVSAMVSISLAIYVYRATYSREYDRIHFWLFVMLISAGWWSLTYLARLHSNELQSILGWLTLEYLGSGLIPTGWIIIAVTYAGFEDYLSRERIAALLAIPAVSFVLVATNPVHELMWTVEGTVELGVGDLSVVERSFGPWFYVNITYAYSLIAVGTLIFLKAFRSSEGPYRGQILALIGMVIAPLLGNLGFLFGSDILSHVEFTSAGFTVTGILIVVAIFRYRVTDLTPIGRESVIESMTDVVVVVDGERRIVNLNPSAKNLFGIDSTPLGRPIHDVLPFDYDTLDELFGEEEKRVTLELEDGNRRYFDAIVTPLKESTTLGWSVLLHETTELQERQSQLERQNERLDEFASIVSHDLRNPLNVAAGSLKLARRDCDSQHLDDIDEAHGRMRSLIEDLLTMAKQGKTVSETEAVELAPLADTCWWNVNKKEVDANLTVETEAVVYADINRLQQLLENLFRNSVEHGTDGSGELYVTVRVGELKDRDGFYVEDNGKGVPREERDKIFQSGYSTHDGGTGLGLSIVKQISEAHGWNVIATDSEEGGVRFEIEGVEMKNEDS